MSDEQTNRDEAQHTPAIKPLQEEPIAGKGRKKSVGREILEWILTFAVAAILALGIRTFLFEPIRVDGNSMYKTLLDGEYMIVTKPEYLLGEPANFDVVICKYPNRKENFVKRVVGIPGDTIEINADGFLYLNGTLQPEEYLENRPNYTGTWELGEGEYFVLGDNRSSSNDSHLIGPITRDMIVGHVQIVVWPLSSIRVVR